MDRPKNILLAKKPVYAIVGTGRCGTGYSAEFLTQAGIPFCHEGYYTFDGPKLRNGRRNHEAIGDASWLAVPYLPDPEVTVVHQLRHPLDVIRSLYNIGFSARLCRYPGLSVTQKVAYSAAMASCIL